MLSLSFLKRMGRAITSSDFKTVADMIEEEETEFCLFLTASDMQLDDFLETLFEAYTDGGLVTAS